MPRSPLHDLEKDAERKAQEYKRQLIEEGMRKLAEEKTAELFSPQGDPLQPPSPAQSHDEKHRRKRRR